MSRSLWMVLWACSSSETSPTETTPPAPTPTEDPLAVDEDEDGATAAVDCDDSDPDLSLPVDWFLDADEDGWLAADAPVVACTAPDGGWTQRWGPLDCDDTDPEVTTRTWYLDRDGDGHGDARYPVQQCDPGPSLVGSSDDCDDDLDSVHPGVPEICDDQDNDCDGAVDEDLPTPAWVPDVDLDGYGDALAPPIWDCEAPAGWIQDATDCDDWDPTVHPSATEICDGIDRDCSGSIDDDEACDPLVSSWIPLDHAVLDAAHDPLSDELVTLSANADELVRVDVATGDASEVSLAAPPLVLAMAPSGGTAAVGHDGLVSFVDLQAGVVTSTVVTTEIPSDLLLDDDGIAWLMPATGQWTTLFAIDPVAGTQTAAPGTVREGSVGALHPDGERLYLTNLSNGDDGVRFDLSAGSATFVGNGPSHSDYAWGLGVWPLPDGSRVVTAAARTYRTTQAADDMAYAGSLGGFTVAVGLVGSVTADSAVNRMLAMPLLDDERLFVYDLPWLALQGEVALPTESVKGTSHPTFGRFVFASGDGQHALVVAEVDPAAGLASPWVVTEIAWGDLP
ncbi:MAG: putative metal-binding motif-containing protein [Myxococcales bacterium]|nr:putative metal-binding motif-containing protein [Myxococcales bacterium]